MVRSDLTGLRFSRLYVQGKTSRPPKIKSQKIYYRCLCDCGKETVVMSSDLRSGHTRSCGCLQAERTSTANLKHGHSMGTGKNSPTYRSWFAMKSRCTNPNNIGYEDYGGRGITVCDRWLEFVNFLEDMGEKPKGKSLDRIDNDGNYEPGNCRWADNITQANNTRKNRYLTHNGRTQSLSEWARELGFHRETLRKRLAQMSVRESLTKPKRITNHTSRPDRG